MPLREPSPRIDVRVYADVLLERYDYEPGPPADIGFHVHDTYQFGLALDHGGEYRYRGATEPVPTGGLILIHPGEPHAVRGREARVERARFLMMYVNVELVRAVAEARLGRAELPYFARDVFEPQLVSSYARLFASAERTELERQGRLYSLLDGLAARHSSDRASARRIAPDHPAIARVKEFIREHAEVNLSLDDLARVAGLSRYHLLHLFTRQVGVPPHTFLQQVRIETAKRLLARGTPASQVALRTGFYDQSHFGRHFRRVVGSTPGRYTAAG